MSCVHQQGIVGHPCIQVRLVVISIDWQLVIMMHSSDVPCNLITQTACRKRFWKHIQKSHNMFAACELEPAGADGGARGTLRPSPPTPCPSLQKSTGNRKACIAQAGPSPCKTALVKSINGAMIKVKMTDALYECKQAVDQLFGFGRLACIVFPIPISSARIPPLISPLSWDTAQAKNSFWKGSRLISISAGGSICSCTCATLTQVSL